MQQLPIRTRSHRTSHPRCFLLLALCLLAATSLAQSPMPSAPGSTPTPAPLSIAVPDAAKPADEDPNSPRATLHVYTNLMQVPVLVLTSDHQEMKPIPEAKFRLRLDSGPWFKPTHVRREGEDPLELAILLDLSRPENELLPGIGAAIASLAPTSLKSWDHVSVYVMDCNLTRTAYDLPPDPEQLRAVIDHSLEGWREHRQHKHAAPCGTPVQLFDAMFLITSQLKSLPGRHALLALTDGVDRGSHITSRNLLRFEQSTSTAVFGLRSRQQMDEQRTGSFDYRQNPLAAGLQHANGGPEDPFDIICQSSGGMQFALSDKGLKKGLIHFVDLLRNRYIIEYPRSNTATAGIHELSVSVPDVFAYVRPAGISVPLADKNLLNNPLTLPAQFEAPIEGPRRSVENGTSAPATLEAPKNQPPVPLIPPS